MPSMYPVLREIYIYPVKSMAGTRVSVGELDDRGLKHDRGWMVVSPDGRLVTQREHPEMALIRPSLSSMLRLDAPGMEPLMLPLQNDGEEVRVWVWKDAMPAHVIEAATAWLSDYLNGHYRLVAMSPSARRPLSGFPGNTLSFVDGNPLHVLSEASLADLSGRLGVSVPVLRFRPNLVVGACQAFEEDGWRTCRIGDLVLQRIGPCTRCVMVNVDPEKGTLGKEPLKTLATYRKVGSEVHFGQHFAHHLMHDGVGSLRLGNAVEILERDTPHGTY